MEISFVKIPVEGYGLITIRTPGVELPEYFLSNSWKDFKKGHIRPQYHLDATASYVKKKDGVVDCYIMCNRAYAEKHNLDIEAYLQEFDHKLNVIINDYMRLLSLIFSDRQSEKLEGENIQDYAERLTAISYKYIPLAQMLEERKN